MAISDSTLRAQLDKVLWIGGAACGGRTTLTDARAGQNLDFETITWLLRMMHLDGYVFYVNDPESAAKESLKRWPRFIQDPSKW